MRPVYKNMHEMLRAIGSRDFRVKFYLSRKEIPIEDYQDLFRVYLDEYSVRNPFRKREHEFKNEKLIKEVLAIKNIKRCAKNLIKIMAKSGITLEEPKNPFEHFKIRFMRRQ
jgi:hypothetical protein